MHPPGNSSSPAVQEWTFWVWVVWDAWDNKSLALLTVVITSISITKSRRRRTEHTMLGGRVGVGDKELCLFAFGESFFPLPLEGREVSSTDMPVFVFILCTLIYSVAKFPCNHSCKWGLLHDAKNNFSSWSGCSIRLTLMKVSYCNE